MLQADAEIIPTRDSRERGRRPEADEADRMDPGPLRHGPGEYQRSQRHELERRLPFGELAYRHRHLKARAELPKARDSDLAAEDDERGDDIEPLDAVHEPPHQDYGRHHDTSCNRIKERPERHNPPLSP